MPLPDWSASRTFKDGCPPVDGELRLPIEDNEHLFAFVMEVVSDPALRLQDSAVQKE
jgi:hypothetical protein